MFNKYEVRIVYIQYDKVDILILCTYIIIISYYVYYIMLCTCFVPLLKKHEKTISDLSRIHHLENWARGHQDLPWPHPWISIPPAVESDLVAKDLVGKIQVQSYETSTTLGEKNRKT